MALATGAGAVGGRLLLRPLRLREYDGPGLGFISGIPGGGVGGRRAARRSGAPVGVLLEPECGHDALRHGVGAGVLRGGICAAGAVVADRGYRVAGQSGDMAGGGIAMVETGRYLVALMLFAVGAQAGEIRYWVEPCTRTETGCRTADPDLAQWAMDAWSGASDGKLKLVRTGDKNLAQIRIYWITT